MKEAIRAAGGLPFEVRTAAPSDFIHSAGRRGTYILPSRDLIVNDIEVQVEGAQLDGMVCLTSCDKTVPGHLMAAARLNIPTLLVICGYQGSGSYHGHHMDIEEVFLGAGHHATGKITLDELKDMSEAAISSPGVCSGMGTANSMHSVCEGLGMSLPGRRADRRHEPRRARARARLGPPHRRDGGGGPAPAPDPDPRRLRQRCRRRAGADRLHQLHQAPAGDRRGGRPRPRRLQAVRGADPAHPGAVRGAAQRRDLDRGAGGGRRRPRRHEAAGRPRRRQRAHRHRQDGGREPRRLPGARRLARAHRAMPRSPPSPASSSCAARWRPTAASSRWG